MLRSSSLCNRRDPGSIPGADGFIIRCCEVDIDLLFARLNLTSTSGLKDLQSDELLKNLDDRSVR